MGRKSKFSTLYQHIILALASTGYTNKQIIEYIEENPSLENINIDTITNWSKQFPSFFSALKETKRLSDERVERSLYEIACGNPDIEEKFEKKMFIDPKTGETVEKMVLSERKVKTSKANVTACIFWLKNRQPDKWRDRIEHKHGGKIESVVTDFKVKAADLTKEQLQDRIKYLVEDHKDKKS